MNFDFLDFPGLVRCISEFEGVGARCVEVFDFMLDSHLAAVWLNGFEGHVVKLQHYGSNDLLYIAAHEIGHFVCNHFNKKLITRFEKKFFPKRQHRREEIEADNFTVKYVGLKIRNEWWDDDDDS
jgi:hypothetical protein